MEDKRTPNLRGEVLGADTTGPAVASRYNIVLDERLIDPWDLVSYYSVDSIGCKGRACYNIPVVIESRTNTAYTAPYKPRHEIRTGVVRVRRISYMC